MVCERLASVVLVAHLDAVASIVLHHEQTRDAIDGFACSGQAHKARVEAGEVLLEVIGTVIFGVDRHEQDLHVVRRFPEFTHE